MVLSRTIVSQIFVELNKASTMPVNSSIQSVSPDPFQPQSCDIFWALCLQDYEDYHHEDKKGSSRLSRWRDHRDAKKRREERRKKEKRKAKQDAILDAEAQDIYESMMLF